MSIQAFLIFISLTVMICSSSQYAYLEASVVGCVAAFIQGFIFFTSVVMLQDAARGISHIVSFGFFIFIFFILQRWTLYGVWNIYDTHDTDVFFYMFSFV